MKSFIKACMAVSLLGVLTAATLISAARAGAAAQDNKMMGAAATQKSLYERLGGEAAISAVIDDFVARVAADSRINQKFARSNVERAEGVERGASRCLFVGRRVSHRFPSHACLIKSLRRRA